jgi:CheY-like chemotaxis protein
MLPDLLLLDLKLPDMEGVELIQQLRRQKPPLKIMVVSGATGEVLQAAHASGADIVLCKPVSVASLVQTIHRLIALPALPV